MPIAVQDGKGLSIVVGLSANVNRDRKQGCIFFLVSPEGQVKELWETEEVVMSILTGLPVQLAAPFSLPEESPKKAPEVSGNVIPFRRKT